MGQDLQVAGSPARPKLKVAEKTKSDNEKPAVRPVWTRQAKSDQLPQAIELKKEADKPSAIATEKKTHTPTEGSKNKPSVTSASKIKDQNAAQSLAKEADRVKSPNGLRSALLTALLAILCVGLYNSHFEFRKGLRVMLNQDGQSETAPPSSDPSGSSAQKRVTFHRDQTGRKLNRERINTEYENEVSAPPIPAGAKNAPQADMMKGVPLAEEQPHRQTSRDRLVPANPDFTDARTMYSLQEQQAAQEYERLAKEKYISDFVANAAKAGIRVRVETNGQVTILGPVLVPGKPPTTLFSSPPSAASLPQ